MPSAAAAAATQGARRRHGDARARRSAQRLRLRAAARGDGAVPLHRRPNSMAPAALGRFAYAMLAVEFAAADRGAGPAPRPGATARQCEKAAVVHCRGRACWWRRSRRRSAWRSSCCSPRPCIRPPRCMAWTGCSPSPCWRSAGPTSRSPRSPIATMWPRRSARVRSSSPGQSASSLSAGPTSRSMTA